jgi:hypothetical protein
VNARLFGPIGAFALTCLELGSVSPRLHAAQAPRDDRQTVLVGAGTIRGRVVNASDSSPIQAARITLAGPSRPDPVFTDQSGQFELAKLAAGRYTVTAEKTGFVRSRYGSKSDLDPFVQIELGAGALAVDIEVRMPKGAAISGRVVDDLGDPIVNSPISIGFLQIVGRDRRLATVGRPDVQTDDRGHYRIGGLAAGRYVVVALPPRISLSLYSRSYYPGVADLSSASPLVLAAGEERTDIDFMVASAKPARVTVNTKDEHGSPVSTLVTLELPGDVPGSTVRTIGMPINGMTSSIEPGDWIAIAYPMPGRGRSVAAFRVGEGEDISLNIVLTQGSRVSGRLVFEGFSPPPPLSSIRLDVRPAGEQSRAGARMIAPKPAAIAADGSFEILDVIGTLSLQLTTPVKGWTLRAARLGDRDLLDEPLTLTSGADVSNIEVILTDRLGQLTGLAGDSEGRPSPGCPIVVFPEAGPAESRWMHLSRADQRGRFTFPDLLPAIYRVSAVADLDPALWQSSDYLERLRPRAARVDLQKGSASELSLVCESLP